MSTGWLSFLAEGSCGPCELQEENGEGFGGERSQIPSGSAGPKLRCVPALPANSLDAQLCLSFLLPAPSQPNLDPTKQSPKPDSPWARKTWQFLGSLYVPKHQAASLTF